MGILPLGGPWESGIYVHMQTLLERKDGEKEIL